VLPSLKSHRKKCFMEGMVGCNVVTSTPPIKSSFEIIIMTSHHSPHETFVSMAFQTRKQSYFQLSLVSGRVIFSYPDWAKQFRLKQCGDGPTDGRTNQWTDQPTDWQTDRQSDQPMDKVSYRGPYLRLRIKSFQNLWGKKTKLGYFFSNFKDE
jgi:hypothetical protein